MVDITTVHPIGVQFDGKCTIFVADFEGKRILTLDLRGKDLQKLVDLEEKPRYLQWIEATKTLFVSDNRYHVHLFDISIE